ncbi:unnamed protein product [Durusdinium trenchii]|uniref:Polyadenylate-binding protein n=2 Tax=Durusdinium trenchii TaxID=1381693 RepID=A0ABP0Q6T5_9DINO
MLYEIFNAVGPVASIRVCRDSVTRKSLGYGYVNFHSVSDAERALDTLNYSSIKGRSCRIMWSQRDPTLRKTGAGNIYVSNLDPNIDNKALYDTFSLFGNILSCKVASDALGKSHGYGFVHYEFEDAARQAIERVNGMMIGEKAVTVCLFQKKDKDAQKRDFTNLYVKYYPQDWDEAKLMEFFSQCGPVTAAAIKIDDKGRKFAFVNYENSEDARKCVDELHGMDLREDKEAEQEMGPDGHPVGHLYVQRAQAKKERQAELRSQFTDTRVVNKAVNLYVKNLDPEVDDSDLRVLFEPFGKVTSAAAVKDASGKCKGFGFVCFDTPDEATKAVTEMHLKVVKGKPLYVGLAERKEARQERLAKRYNAPSGFGGFGYNSFGGKGKKGKGKNHGHGGKDMSSMDMMGPQQGMMMNNMNMPGMGMNMGGMMRPPQMMGMMQPPMMCKGGPGQQSMPPMKGGMPCMGKGPMPPMGQGPMNPMMGMRPNMQPMQPMMRPPNPQMNPQVNQAVQKQMIGEKLYPMVAKWQPDLAGKITGMMLEMDNQELIHLLESEQRVREKVDEALRVIQQAHRS